MRDPLRFAPVVLLLGGPTISCGSDSKGLDVGGGGANGDAAAMGVDGAAGDANGVSLVGDASTAGGPCASASDRERCPCTVGSPPRACSTGSPSGGGGLCVVGQQSCVSAAEGQGAWGPCNGAAGSCTVADAGPNVVAAPPVDAGADADAASDADASPGADATSPLKRSCQPLSVGALHACAITPAGGLKCWGGNTSGQFGNGVIDNGQSPNLLDMPAVDVLGLTSGVACVVAGETHTCALTTAGGVKCWGSYGTTAADSWGPTPVDMPGLSSGVVDLASGEFDTCAVLADGGVECWGSGGEEETDPTTAYGGTPQPVAGVPSGVSAVQMSDGFGCVLTAAGAVLCWGGNSLGELGTGSMTPSATPVAVPGLGSGVTSLSANGGTQACAVMAGGGLRCWGTGALVNSASPVDIQGLAGAVRSISVGGETFACAIMGDESVRCWSPMGAGAADASAGTPPPAPSLPPVQFVAVNEACACAMVTGGKVYCWGGACVPNGWYMTVEVAGF